MRITEAQLEHQYQSAKREGWIPDFSDAGYGVSAEVLMGVASRETNMQNIIGDRGHGHGIMQIDDRSFPHWCATQKWRDVGEGIKMGAFVLRSKYNDAQTRGVPKEDLLKVALASYNAGRNPVTDDLHGVDPDRHTTGHDYYHDVMRRALVFKRLLQSDQ